MADNTEEITAEIANKIKQLIKQKSWLHRRLVEAYPNLKFEKIEIIKDRLKKKKEKLERKLHKNKNKIK